MDFLTGGAGFDSVTGRNQQGKLLPVFRVLMIFHIAVGGFAQVCKIHTGPICGLLQRGHKVENMFALNLLHGWTLVARNIGADLCIIQFGFHKASFCPRYLRGGLFG